MEKAKVRLMGAGAAFGLLALVGARVERTNREAPPIAAAQVAAPMLPSTLAARVESAPRAVAARHEEAGDAGVAVGSLRGTDVDGTLQVDADGRFVANAEAVRLFDYFLSTEGEAPAEVIRERVADEAHRQLPATEAARAMALFDRYVAYRHDGDGHGGTATRGDFRGALAAAHTARVTAFGEDDAQRMFGRDEALARASIAESEALTSDAGDDDRARLVAQAEQGLPPEIRAMHERRAAEAAKVAALVAASTNH